MRKADKLFGAILSQFLINLAERDEKLGDIQTTLFTIFMSNQSCFEDILVGRIWFQISFNLFHQELCPSFSIFHFLCSLFSFGFIEILFLIFLIFDPFLFCCVPEPLSYVELPSKLKNGKFYSTELKTKKYFHGANILLYLDCIKKGPIMCIHV